MPYQEQLLLFFPISFNAKRDYLIATYESAAAAAAAAADLPAGVDAASLMKATVTLSHKQIFMLQLLQLLQKLLLQQMQFLSLSQE